VAGIFCSKCGVQIADSSIFCEKSGAKIIAKPYQELPKNTPKPRIMLNPDEAAPSRTEKDSSKTFRGMGKIFGVALVLCSILVALISMFTIGTIGFIPLTILGTVMFVLGFFITIFSH
jgi:hypothetical protein